MSNVKLSAVLIAMLLVALFTTGCDGVDQTCKVLGICDEPVKAAVFIEIVCDRSSGSTCTRESLLESLERVLAFVVDRPGSHVRIWMMGSTVDKTVAVAEQTIPAVKRGSERSRRAQTAKIAASARDVLLSGAATAFEAPSVRRSPIAESVTKIALADAGSLPRKLIVLTDAREVSSLGDFECGRVPGDAQFAALLRRLSLLTPGLLTGVDVTFSYVTSTSVPGRGCIVSIDRDIRVRKLWTAALRGSGAATVRIVSGPADLQDQDGADAPKEAAR
ncbi:MAG: hypothetical protein IT376_23605 [Polyangiaceae bacterium]|nr:hypothetical protein [Polyangiaceae bacterium]